MDLPRTELLSRTDYAHIRCDALIKDLRGTDLWTMEAEWLLSEASFKIQEALESLRRKAGTL